VSFSFYASYIALWALVVFQGLVALALLQQLTKLRQFLALGGFSEDQLPEGSQAPEFANVDKRSSRESGVKSLEGRGGVVLFLSSECLVCRGLVDELGRSAADDLPVTIAFCHGKERGCARFARRLGTRVRLVLDGAEKTASHYHISNFPTAVVVDDKGKIRLYGHPQAIGEIKDLWSRSLAKDSPRQGEEGVFPSALLRA
jgi:hypothetical protein